MLNLAILKQIILVGSLLVLSGCVHNDEAPPTQAKFQVSKDTVEPGSAVTIRGQSIKLYKGSLKVGDNLSKKSPLIEPKDMVTIISVVPSIDTPVCELQTHQLGETPIPEGVKLVTVSRDLPMAQQRFAKAAGLTNVSYVSDYKFGSFGKATGLLMEGPEVLARALIVVDRQGVVKHIQIVPNVGELPDLEKAIEVAKSL
jgi:thiol peroxidase